MINKYIALRKMNLWQDCMIKFIRRCTIVKHYHLCYTRFKKARINKLFSFFIAIRFKHSWLRHKNKCGGSVTQLRKQYIKQSFVVNATCINKLMLTRSHKMFLWVLKHNCQQALIISRVVNATKNI